MERLINKIRDIPDFPKPGIIFKDITPLVKDPAALRLAVHQLLHPFLGREITAKASCELVAKLGATVVACAFVVELDFLCGREKLRDYEVHSLVHF